MKPKPTVDGIPVNPVVLALEEAMGKKSDPFDMRDLEDAGEYMARKIGETMKAVRVAAGLTQAELAAKVNESEAMVSGIEDGSVAYGPGYMEAVFKACGLP